MNDPTTGAPGAIPPLLPPSGTGGGATTLVCPNCRMETAVNVAGPELNFSCSFCKSPVSVRVFPRLTKEPKLMLGANLAGGGDATCQFYPELKAEVVCDECGCFMSEKASITWAGRVLCMPCLHNLREQKADLGYRANLKIWDNRALGLIAMLPVTLFTAPVALFLLLRYRKEPRSWVPRSGCRWWLALSLTILVLLGWTSLIVIWVAMMAREMS